MSGKNKIFLSSSMLEFKNERVQIKKELEGYFDVFLYEDDAVASRKTIKETFLKEVGGSDLYIGIFGLKYGKHTIEEFEWARDNNIPLHIYVKQLAGDEKRDPLLQEIIDEIEDVETGHTTRWFQDLNSLIKGIRESIGHEISIGQPKEKSDKLSQDKKYYCDRYDQSDDYSYACQNEQAFNFFLLQGDKYQSHKSLVLRFGMEYEGDVREVILLRGKSSLERQKLFMQRELFRVFNISPLPSKPEEFVFKNFITNLVQDHYKRAFVIFSMDEELLKNENVIQGLDWFVNSYCNPDNFLEGAPNFHFFLNVKYSSQKVMNKRAVRKQIEKLSDYSELELLNDVDVADIGNWLYKNGIAPNETVKESLLQKYFSEGKYPMDRAEMKIAELISLYNNKDQALYSLIQKA